MTSDCRAAPTKAEEDALNELTAQLSQFNWKDGVVDKAKRLLYSSDVEDNIQGVLSLKAMLCIGREEVSDVAQEVIDGGVTCRLVEFLHVDNSNLQLPAAFCLTNVAAGLDSQTETVVRAGAIDPLIRFLTHPDGQLRRQAVFCLANVAGSTPEHRVMLAKHPHFFSGMFSAARMTMDPKVFELICWNLRNICLLGGPSFQDLLPGVIFLLNQVLKQHWKYRDSSVCVGFALETLCAMCPVTERREALLKAGLFPCLFSVLSLLPTNPVVINESAFRAVTWILANGSTDEIQEFVQQSSLLQLIIDRAIPGQCGPVVQELALKCFVCITSVPELRASVLQTHMEPLFELTRRIFLTATPAAPLPDVTDENSQYHVHECKSAGPRSAGLCSSFLFAHLVITASTLPELLWKIIATADAVTLLVSMLEFSINENTVANVAGTNDAQLSQPNLPGLLENTAVVLLEAIVELVRQGEVLKRTQPLQENPVVRFLVSCDAVRRLQHLLQNTSLPPQTLESVATIMHQLSQCVSTC